MSGLSPAQIELRLTGITATDIAALTGHHPYRSPVDVYCEKIGTAPPFDGNKRTKWGLLLEDPIRRDYAERHGAFVEQPGTLVHPVDEWAIATPDGVVYVGRQLPVGPADRGLEIKCHTIFEAWRYGEPGTDEVPMHELLQCVWNMYVRELARWDLVAFIDGQPSDYIIERDDELIGMMREIALKFRRDTAQGIPPAADGTKGYDEYLRRSYPQHAGDDLIPVDAADEDVLDLLAVTIELADAEDREERIKQRIKARIGDKSGLVWKEGKADRKITWRKAADGSKVNHALALVDACGHAALTASATADRARALALELREGNHGQHDAADLIDQLHDALVQLSQPQRFIAARTSPVPGTRRLNRPRTWKQRREKTED
jgi:putative phage-type endonuclease